MIPTRIKCINDMILIDAIYICQTGGKKLLDLLIDQFEKESTKEEIIFLIDNRIKEFYIDREFQQIKVEFLKGGEFNRYKYYSKNKNIFRKVFCFANVPPPIRLECTVMTYFQNVLLLDRDIQKYFPFKSRLLFRLKGYIIKKRLKNTDSYIVQTSHVKDILVKSLNYNIDQIKIIPFFNDETLIRPIEINEKENAFFFPSIGVSHKNHAFLLEAWSNLYHKGKLKYDLYLTIDKKSNSKLFSKIEKLKNEGIPIINHGYLSRYEVNNLYAKCKFVIHPSIGESFGLVLIEAITHNCILIAPDLPYVNAIVRPNYYFNPISIVSIEDAILLAVTGNKQNPSKILIQNQTKNLVNYLTN